MKRIITLLVTAVLWSSSPLVGQTVDEIIAKYIDARGGIRKMKSVQSQRLSGHILLGDVEGTILIERKRPGKLREEISLEGRTLIRATDGKTGWSINPFSGDGAPGPLSADDFRLITRSEERRVGKGGRCREEA